MSDHHEEGTGFDHLVEPGRLEEEATLEEAAAPEVVHEEPKIIVPKRLDPLAMTTKALERLTEENSNAP